MKFVFNYVKLKTNFEENHRKGGRLKAPGILRDTKTMLGGIFIKEGVPAHIHALESRNPNSGSNLPGLPS